MEDSRAFPVELPIPVRAYDIDALGHVNNVVYVRWLEDLRTAILDTYLPYQQLMAEQISPVLTRTEIDYKKPIKLFEPVMGRAWISLVKGVRMYMNFEFTVNGQVRSTAVQTGVFFHIKKERPVRPPADFSRQWQAHFHRRETSPSPG